MYARKLERKLFFCFFRQKVVEEAEEEEEAEVEAEAVSVVSELSESSQ